MDLRLKHWNLLSKPSKQLSSYLRPYFCLFYTQILISRELLKLQISLILSDMFGIFMDMRTRSALQTELYALRAMRLIVLLRIESLRLRVFSLEKFHLDFEWILNIDCEFCLGLNFLLFKASLLRLCMNQRGFNESYLKEKGLQHDG